MRGNGYRWLSIAILSVVLLAGSGCRATEVADLESESSAGEILVLPELGPVDLRGKALQVVATTSIIGDVVGRVGGEAIVLTTLMEPGQDPHSYQPAAQDMVAVSEAHVVFVNGWDLEEALVRDLEHIAEDVPMVAVSSGIEPLAFGDHDKEHEGDASQGDEDHLHESADPHTWFSVRNVKQWVDNVVHVLAALDPANAETFEANAEAYRTELEALEAHVESQLSSIPPENRYLVTNHDSFAYLAHTYGLQVLGTVIPSASTMAEPSASALAALTSRMDEYGVCTIFTEATVSDKMAQMVASELDGCDQVQVLKLYTGSVGPPGSGADSYIEMMRYDVDKVVEGLR